MRIVALLAALLLASPAAAQVAQYGNVTPGHNVMWCANGIICDAGTAQSTQVTSIGTNNGNGPSICANSGNNNTAGGYVQICLGATQAGGGTLTVNSYNGGTGALSFLINGVALSTTLAGSGTTGNIAAWAGSTTLGNATSAEIVSTLNSGAITGNLIASGTITNTNLANMAAVSVKCNLTGSAAAPTDCTTLPFPFTEGTSLYPSISGSGAGFRYNSSSNFLVNALGAEYVLAGLASQDSSTTWVNSIIGGIDARGAVSLYGISPHGTFGVAAATRSQDNVQGTAQNIIADACVAQHDNTSIGHLIWCRYDATTVVAGSAVSHTIDYEMDTNNLSGSNAPSQDPYTINPSGSIEDLRLSTGIPGEGSPLDIGAFMIITNNAAPGISGIVVANGALDTSVTTHPAALALPTTYAVTWYASAATPSVFVYADTTPNFNIRGGGMLHSYSPGATATFMDIFINSHQTAGDYLMQLRAGALASTDASTIMMQFTWADGSTQVGVITRANGNTVTYGTSSDQRMKENIADTTHGLNDIRKIHVRDFNFIDGSPRMQGYIAQELYPVYPEAVVVGGDDVRTQPWSVDYGRLTPLALRGIQELDERVSKLEHTK